MQTLNSSYHSQNLLGDAEKTVTLELDLELWQKCRKNELNWLPIKVWQENKISHSFMLSLIVFSTNVKHFLLSASLVYICVFHTLANYIALTLINTRHPVSWKLTCVIPVYDTSELQPFLSPPPAGLPVASEVLPCRNLLSRKPFL